MSWWTVTPVFIVSAQCIWGAPFIWECLLAAGECCLDSPRGCEVRVIFAHRFTMGKSPLLASSGEIVAEVSCSGELFEPLAVVAEMAPIP